MTHMNANTNNALLTLSDLIRAQGPVGAVRVSSAQARGAAKRFPYWGAVRYEIRVGRDGTPSCVAIERASSDRRSRRLAEQDAERIAETEDRVECQRIGRLAEADAARVLQWLGAAVGGAS